MADFKKLPFSKGELNTKLADFFKDMLEKKTVDALLAPMVQPKKGVMQTLVTHPSHVEAIDIFAPVVPVNAAKLASSLTSNPSGRKVAMVLRSCEIRALIELVKLKQAHLEDVLLIGMDCLGRYENQDFFKFQEQGNTSEDFIENALAGNTAFNDTDISAACKICEFPVADNVDLRLCIIAAGSGELLIESLTEKGEKALDSSDLSNAGAPKERQNAVQQLTEARINARDLLFKEHRETVNSIDALENEFAKCINCYNCRVACPVCYCKECVFVTDTFRHNGDQYMSWADSRGTLKMPADTIFFHLTRMAHIGLFCVGCGQCSSACPNDINLMPIFRTIAQKTQDRFDYQAGRSVDEPQPLAVFHDDEFIEVTGQVK
ncbi:MAG: formate dehydrogenase [Thermodesulfobacteriota bacterium]|nr:formate dehydrogenase [Thermodesulfobacteriota bacterium]